MTPSRRAATAAGALAARSRPCAAPPGAAGARLLPAAAWRGSAWAHVGQAGQGGAKAEPPYGVQAPPSRPAPRPALGSCAGAAPAASPAAQAAPGACSCSRAGSSAAARHAPGRCAGRAGPAAGGGEAAEARASAAAGQSASRAARARSGAGQQKGGGGDRRRRRGGAAGRGRRWRSGVTGRLHAGLPACVRRPVWSAVLQHMLEAHASEHLLLSGAHWKVITVRLAVWLPRATRRAWGGRGNFGSACAGVGVNCPGNAGARVGCESSSLPDSHDSKDCAPGQRQAPQERRPSARGASRARPRSGCAAAWRAGTRHPARAARARRPPPCRPGSRRRRGTGLATGPRPCTARLCRARCCLISCAHVLRTAAQPSDAGLAAAGRAVYGKGAR
jgi:hypothetical protein